MTTLPTLYMERFQLANPIITAPMAGITDRAYREILHQMGAGLVFTEMLSDKALTYGDKKTIALLHVEGEVPPIGVQLCGSEPEVMAAAAQIIEDKAKATGNIKLIDINMGCPVNKIVKNGEGSRLMQRPEIAERIVQQVVQAVSLPITVKMRLGWNEEQKNVVEFARRMEAAGAQAITIHGRTREQFYTGTADWTLIGTAKEQCNIPIIGNGDITTAPAALEQMQKYHCDGVMIGRGMLGNPWLIRDAVSLWQTGRLSPAPTMTEIIQQAIQHLQRQVELCGEYIAVRQMRSHLPWYIKGWRNAAAMRHQINQETSAAVITEMLLQYGEQLQSQQERVKGS